MSSLEAGLFHELVLEHETEGRRLNVSGRVSLLAQDLRKAAARRAIDLLAHLGLIGEELRVVPAQDSVLPAVGLPLV